MTEKEQFDVLCKYVKENILKYDDTMKLPKYLILRLRGLRQGKFIANKKQESEASYGYDIILKTFKYISYDIRNYLTKNGDRIKDEQHLINLIMTFVEKDINNVVEKLRQKQIEEEKMENIDNSQINASKGKYIKKTDNKKFRKDLR